MRIRVLLADDHAVLRETLRVALDDATNIEVVGEAATGREALTMVADLRPDVVIIDVGMPDLNGIDATRSIVSDHPTVRVVGLSAHSEQQYVMPMLDAGAAGYALKGGTLSELVHAVKVVAQGKKYLSPELVQDVIDRPNDRELPDGLTVFSVLGKREREVLQLLSEGRTSKEIGKELHISPGTVETHRRNIMRKLDLHSVAELTRYAIREGLSQL